MHNGKILHFTTDSGLFVTAEGSLSSDVQKAVNPI